MSDVQKEQGTKTPLSKLKPRVADEATILRLAQPEEEWPKGLFRFCPFKRFRDGEDVQYRAICWNPLDRELYVLKLFSKGAPKGPGEWLVWSADAPDSPLKDIRRVDDTIVPDYAKNEKLDIPRKYRKALNGFAIRKQIVQAFCMLDTGGNGDEKDLVFNERVVTDSAVRTAAQRFVSDALDKPHGWESYVRRLFHQYVHFAGAPRAMLAQHKGKGVTGERGNLTNKPGRLSHRELSEKRRSEATGKPVRYRRRPTNSDDKAKFLDALMKYWVKRKNLARTYDKLVLEHYVGFDEMEIPTVDTFRYHARELIVKHGLLALRNGAAIQGDYFDAHTGTANDYTQGKVEVVDVDGFTAKLAVRIRVRGKWQNTYLKVILAISRNSHALLGAAIVFRGESAVSYRRCIASCFLDKEDLAKRLGLKSAEGLLHGNIDGVYVDNGAGAAKDNVEVVCGELTLGFEIAPPAKGRYKGIIENFNSLLVQLWEDLPSGHSRRRDKVAQEERRKARVTRGISIRQFERLIWASIQYHNLHANRDYLRAHCDFVSGHDGTPADNFEASKLKRRGDGQPELTPREVHSKFIPWKEFSVRRGLVHFKKKLRYTSDELKAAYAEHMKISNKNRGPFKVEVKRLDGLPYILIWRVPGGPEGLLMLLKQDAMRVGKMTWSQLEMTYEADARRKLTNEPKQRKGREKLTVEQHDSVTDAEEARRAGEMTEMEGSSMNDAKDRAAAYFDTKWGEEQAVAMGIDTKQHVPADATAEAQSSGADKAFAARFRAKKAAQNGVPPVTQSH